MKNSGLHALASFVSWGLLAACSGTATNSPVNGGNAGVGGATGGQAASGGTSAVAAATGGAIATLGGTANTGGKAAVTGGHPSVGGTAAGGSSSTAACNNSALTWKSANKTNYTSYPDPGSEECIKYNGCTWAGQFAACDGTKSETWVAAHSIVSLFPDFAALMLHDLCLRKGQNTIVVTVLDTCADSDCSGCCTQNKGSASELIDIESYTDARWGVPDGSIEWADLGPTMGSGCN